MTILSRRSYPILALAAGCAPLFLALSLHGQPAPPAPGASVALTPRQIAEDLDAIMQPRFQDDRAGVFGTGRVVPMIGGHIAVSFFQPTEAERQHWLQANTSQRPFVVAFLHCAHVPGKFRDMPPPNAGSSVSASVALATPKAYLSELIDQSFTPAVNPNDPKVRLQKESEAEARHSLFQQTATAALPALLKGKAQEKVAGGWLVVMRPVHASKDSCLTCHHGAKQGDTLGVMVYAVSNTLNKN